jgi:hypothetical protein
MIDTLKFNKSLSDLVDFISNKNNLYITIDNKRKSIKTLKDLKALYRQSAFAIRKSVNTITHGLLFVWKSNSESKRNYIKIEYNTLQDVEDLLTVFNWKFAKEVFIKLPENSELINSFRKKGFKFYSGRGTEILLRRDKNDRKFIPPYKEEDEDE